MNPLTATVHSQLFLAAFHRHSFSLHFSWSVQAILALAAGVLILVRPKFLTMVVAVYLIVVGLLGIIHWN